MRTTLTNDRGESLYVTYSLTNVHITDSYAVPSKSISDWVTRIISYGAKNGYTYERSAKSWVEEWKVHNALYKLGIQKSRTKDVDLNEDETVLRKLGYCLLSKFI